MHHLTSGCKYDTTASPCCCSMWFKYTFSKPGIKSNSLCLVIDPVTRVVGAVLLWSVEIVMQLPVIASAVRLPLPVCPAIHAGIEWALWVPGFMLPMFGWCENRGPSASAAVRNNVNKDANSSPQGDHEDVEEEYGTLATTTPESLDERGRVAKPTEGRSGGKSGDGSRNSTIEPSQLALAPEALPAFVLCAEPTNHHSHR
ncbi:hypothetical protein C8R43DRAFT_1113198 [Mycena crocata]|nr:hypothetical protein C8R43DRAFT_1113198 [Mycena crocata]